MKLIDNFLDQITMYKLVLYFLIFLLGVATVLSFFGILAFSPVAIIFSTIFILAVSYITNRVFAYAFEAPINTESVHITALILALIVTPTLNVHGFPFLFWAPVLSIASKYIFALNKKHIFNPAAFGVAICALTGVGSASWWVGTAWMLPFVLLGIFIVKKIRRFDLFFYFTAVAIVTIVGLGTLKGTNPIDILRATLVQSPLIFFATIMLTEPLTTPPTKTLQAIYGGIAGFLFSPQIHLGSFYTTPELALLMGNIFSYIVSSKAKLILTLREKVQIGDDIVHFVLNGKNNFSFVPGQYLEWTLPHEKIDSRGNRRYLTIASSPTEDNIGIGVKFVNNGSSFKKALDKFGGNQKIIGAQLAGDFTLPSDKSKKLVFVAGGIGVTPYRSMIKYLVDKSEKRDIVLIYSNKYASEIAYKDVFDEAEKKLGLKTVYTLTDKESIPKGWSGRVGRIDADIIKQEIPDFPQRTFYLSGPQAMVDSYKSLLKHLGVAEKQIVTDYFPGFA